MQARRATWTLLLGLLAILIMASAWPRHVAAQSLFDDFAQDDFVESEDGFVDESDPFAAPSGEDYTEGGRFIDEEAAIRRGAITISGRQTQLRLQSERELLPRNVAWGAGTGLLIGGWFALIENGSDRQTQRSIGLGVVLGALLGMTVGLKTVIAPDAPRAAMAHPADGPLAEVASPALAATALPDTPFRLSFAMRF